MTKKEQLKKISKVRKYIKKLNQMQETVYTDLLRSLKLEDGEDLADYIFNGFGKAKEALEHSITNKGK